MCWQTKTWLCISGGILLLGVAAVGFIGPAPEAEASMVAQQAPGRVPVGTIVAYAGLEESIPDGWMLCDGRQIPIAGHLKLFQTILDFYGPLGADATFTLPDLRARYATGKDTNDSIGETLGDNLLATHDHVVFSVATDDQIAVTEAQRISEAWGPGTVFLRGTTLNSSPANASGSEKVVTEAPAAEDQRPESVVINFIIRG